MHGRVAFADLRGKDVSLPPTCESKNTPASHGVGIGVARRVVGYWTDLCADCAVSGYVRSHRWLLLKLQNDACSWYGCCMSCMQAGGVHVHVDMSCHLVDGVSRTRIEIV